MTISCVLSGNIIREKRTNIKQPNDLITALQAAGIAEIVVARIEPGDVSEDVAAVEIAVVVVGEGVCVDRVFIGWANLFVKSVGVLVVEKDAIDRLN